MRGENRHSYPFVSALILSAPAYSPHYFPFKHHYFPSESVNLFRTLNRATIGHLRKGGEDKIAHPCVLPRRFPSNAWTIFCKMATYDDELVDDEVCAYITLH